MSLLRVKLPFLQVIEHFHTKLHEADLKMPTTAEIAQVIERAAKTWSASKLKVFRAYAVYSTAELHQPTGR